MKQNIILLIIGLAVGIMLALLFQCNHTEQNMVLKPTELKQQAAADERKYTVKIDSFEQEAKAVAQQLSDTRTQLASVQQKNKPLQQQLQTLVNKPASNHKLDTAMLITNYDSIRTAVVSLITSDNEKDSLYIVMDNDYQLQLSLKDSIIRTQYDEYISLRQTFNQSIDQLNNAAAQIKTLKKQAKRQRVKSKLLTVGGIVVGVIVAGLVVGR
jgi:hypothetical protein